MKLIGKGAETSDLPFHWNVFLFQVSISAVVISNLAAIASSRNQYIPDKQPFLDLHEQPSWSMVVYIAQVPFLLGKGALEGSVPDDTQTFWPTCRSEQLRPGLKEENWAAVIFAFV